MNIEPNTTINIYANIPVNSENVRLFSDKSEQNTYFASAQKVASFAPLTYQRVNIGVIRVPASADSLYNANYLAFQNTAFGTKWFYGYIDTVEYVSNDCAEIRYTLDMFQTYFYDCELMPCFVEREHSETDEVGDNIIAEPVSVGEYVYTDFADYGIMKPMTIAIVILDYAKKVVEGNLYDGVYSGGTIHLFKSNDISGINAKLTEYQAAGQPNSVLSMYMLPSFLVNNATGILSYSEKGVTLNLALPNYIEDFSGYVPKNKKLFTYPFSYYIVTNNSGSTLALRREFFYGGEYEVEVGGTVTQPVKTYCRPKNYKGATLNTCETLTLDNYPICSWGFDGYGTWIAQNAIPLALSTVAGTANSVVASTLSAHPAAAAITSTVGLASSLLSNYYTASISADLSRGSLNNGGVNFSNQKQVFSAGIAHVTKDYAECIDNFFSMFGYACQKVKKPNIDSRPNWNYVKTTNANVVGDIPAPAKQAIENMLNNGVTFWHTNDIGNYDLENEV